MLEQEGLSEYIGDTWNQQDLLFSLIAGLICALRLWYSAPGAERAPCARAGLRDAFVVTLEGGGRTTRVRVEA